MLNVMVSICSMYPMRFFVTKDLKELFYLQQLGAIFL